MEVRKPPPRLPPPRVVRLCAATVRGSEVTTHRARGGRLLGMHLYRRTRRPTVGLADNPDTQEKTPRPKPCRYRLSHPPARLSQPSVVANLPRGSTGSKSKGRPCTRRRSTWETPRLRIAVQNDCETPPPPRLQISLLSRPPTAGPLVVDLAPVPLRLVSPGGRSACPPNRRRCSQSCRSWRCCRHRGLSLRSHRQRW